MIVGDCRSATKYTVDEGVEAKRVKEEEGLGGVYFSSSSRLEHEISAIGASFHIRGERETWALRHEEGELTKVKEKNKRVKKRRACLERQFCHQKSVKNVAECREGRIHIGRPLEISKWIKKVIKNPFLSSVQSISVSLVYSRIAVTSGSPFSR